MTNLNNQLDYQSSFNCLLDWTVSENGDKDVIRPEKLLKIRKKHVHLYFSGRNLFSIKIKPSSAQCKVWS